MVRPQRRVVTDILRLRPGDIYGLGGNDTNSDGGDDELRGNNGQDRLDSRDGVRGNDALQDVGMAGAPAMSTGWTPSLGCGEGPG